MEDDRGPLLLQEGKRNGGGREKERERERERERKRERGECARWEETARKRKRV